MAWPDELVIQLETSPKSGRSIARLEVDGDYVLEMYVDPRIDRSSISVTAWQDLFVRRLVPTEDMPRICPLRALQLLDGQRIPDLEVEINPELRDVDGVLGFDAFRPYPDIEFDPARRRFTLKK